MSHSYIINSEVTKFQILSKNFLRYSNRLLYPHSGLLWTAEYVGHEIKENTELAEHDIGVQNVKKSTKTVYNKMKEAL